jgi:hypothetical protein
MAKHFIPDRRGPAFDTYRRQVLWASGVAITTAGMALCAEGAETTEPAQEIDLTKASPIASEIIWASNISDTTALRIKEIEARNRLREEVGLPLLSIPKELRRMKTAADQEAFQKFEAIHANAVWDEVLKPIRDEMGDSNWRPGCMRRMALQNDIYRILHHRFPAASFAQNC